MRSVPSTASVTPSASVSNGRSAHLPAAPRQGVDALVDRLVAPLHQAVGVEHEARAVRERDARLRPGGHAEVGAERGGPPVPEQDRLPGRVHEHRRQVTGAGVPDAAVAQVHLGVRHRGRVGRRHALDEPVQPGEQHRPGRSRPSPARGPRCAAAPSPPPRAGRGRRRHRPRRRPGRRPARTRRTSRRPPPARRPPGGSTPTARAAGRRGMLPRSMLCCRVVATLRCSS